jgi:probable phosphoglycerate mutase
MRASPLRREIESELESIFRLNDEDATEVVLIRHAETSNDPLEDGLSLAGNAQARAVAHRLASLWLDCVYTAPEQPCYETSRILFDCLGAELQVCYDLRDLQIKDDCSANSLPGQSDASWARERFLCQPRWDAIPGAEPTRGFRSRSIQAIEKIIAAHPARRVAVVTHASVINAYLSMLLDIPRDVFFSPDYASISIIRSHQDLYAVRSINDTGHLRHHDAH